MAAPGAPGPEPLLAPDEIAAHLDELAARIAADHPQGLTLVGVLKSSVLLLVDLARRLAVPTRLEVVSVAPYDGATGRTRIVKDLDRPVVGESVVVVTGIVDTGLTADFVLRHVRAGDPARVSLCTLVDKRARRIVPVEVAYRAIEPPDAFVIGYGLDYAGRYRNLPGLWTADAAALASDPDRYRDELYGRVR